MQKVFAHLTVIVDSASAHDLSAVTAGVFTSLLEGAQALHPRKLHSQNVTEMAYAAQNRSVRFRQFYRHQNMSQEVSKRLGSVEVGYKPFTNH